MNYLEVKTLVVGQLATNCYLLYDPANLECIIIDPGDDADFIAGEIIKNHFTPLALIATHGHFDHVMAAGMLQDILNVPFYINEKDIFLLSRMRETAHYFLHIDIDEYPPKKITTLSIGEFHIGSLRIKILGSPGHTPGSVSLLPSEFNGIFVGDLIFAGGNVGRTDFSYSSHTDLLSSIDLIQKNTSGKILYPGHGELTKLLEKKRQHTRPHE